MLMVLVVVIVKWEPHMIVVTYTAGLVCMLVWE